MSNWVKFRLTIGAQVLIPKAAHDLIVPVEPRHHQQLLENLRWTGAMQRTCPHAAGSAPGNRGAPSGVDLPSTGVSRSM